MTRRVVQLSELEAVAERYGETVEENARLYNEVQDLKGRIRVFCRVRPAGATGDGASSCTEVGVDGQVRLSPFQELNHGIIIA